MNAYERNIAGEVGAGGEKGNVRPHVEEIVDATVVAVGLEGVWGWVNEDSSEQRVREGARTVRRDAGGV